ncbi:hypothetical protein L0664_07020 [Octadecabacter sp. G9-8]|uniref:Response regulatory domain-containing protein n=1 Tax=Octadecabacter dasysiphoniae TaxID=2909341 RepID=A0ABS9CXL3_9RHOB|nr:hypothetical protein [Octadecabacter dasysiphoniae]MCF2870813.1 hypothetical protein [Octadecabacter dasysiphoniae]
MIPMQRSAVVQPHSAEYMADQLFQEYDRQQEADDAALWSRSVVALCAQNGRAKDIVMDLSDDVGDITTCDSVSSVLRYATNCDGAMTIALLDIDLMDELHETVPRLLTLRQANPELVIVIMSRTFAHSDFSAERARIADASVRLPASQSTLLAAFRAAVSNTKQRLEL